MHGRYRIPCNVETAVVAGADQGRRQLVLNPRVGAAASLLFFVEAAGTALQGIMALHSAGRDSELELEMTLCAGLY
jgi:hypothetical protein